MKYVAIIQIVLLLSAASFAAGKPGKPQRIMSCGFDTDPIAAGWMHARAISPGNWQDTAGRNGGHCLFTNEGTWTSPQFAVTPFNYYRCIFWSKVLPRPAGTPWSDPDTAPPTPDGYPAVWSAQSYDTDKRPLVSDHYWGVDLSDDWVKHEYITYGKANSAYMSLSFEPYAKTAMSIDDVSVELVDYDYAARWVDRQFAQMPQHRFTADKDRWQYIPKTMETLKNGGKIRIVMLGDSICNDTSNSSWHALVQRMYPNAKLEVVSSVRGGTGNVWYQQDNRVKEYVIDYKPDLLIIAGISQGYDAEAARSVIKQVRAAINPEIMFMTPVVGPGDPCKDSPNDHKAADFRAAMQKVCSEEKVEYVDMWDPWKDYVCSSSKPVYWLRRDHLHANVRGAIVLAKIIEAFFAPKR